MCWRDSRAEKRTLARGEKKRKCPDDTQKTAANTHTQHKNQKST
jgi:hypothetical protein